MRSLASTLAAALFCAAPLCAASSASVVAEKSSAQRAGEQLLSQLKAQGTCGTAGVDLSSLTQTTGATDYSYSDKDGHNTWYVNVCADTVAPCQGDQTTSPGVWNYDFKQPYACFGLGQGSSAVWTSASDKISVKYTGGDACYNVQPASTYTLQIDFTCDPNSQTPALTMVGPGATLCDYVGTFTTPLMCSGSFGGGGGGKAAWAFNIAVLAGIPAYFLFGFLINMFAFKKEGSDRIPQLSFWANLPGLVKDGNLYFIYLLRVAFFKCGAGALPEPFVPSTPTEYGSSSESSGDSSAGSSYSYPAADTPSSGGGGGGYGTI